MRSIRRTGRLIYRLLSRKLYHRILISVSISTLLNSARGPLVYISSFIILRYVFKILVLVSLYLYIRFTLFQSPLIPIAYIIYRFNIYALFIITLLLQTSLSLRITRFQHSLSVYSSANQLLKFRNSFSYIHISDLYYFCLLLFLQSMRHTNIVLIY